MLWFNCKMLKQNSGMPGVWPVVLCQRSLALLNAKIKMSLEKKPKSQSSDRAQLMMRLVTHKAQIEGFGKLTSKKGNYHKIKKHKRKSFVSCTISGEQERWRNFRELFVRKKNP